MTDASHAPLPGEYAELLSDLNARKERAIITLVQARVRNAVNIVLSETPNSAQLTEVASLLFLKKSVGSDRAKLSLNVSQGDTEKIQNAIGVATKRFPHIQEAVHEKIKAIVTQATPQKKTPTELPKESTGAAKEEAPEPTSTEQDQGEKEEKTHEKPQDEEQSSEESLNKLIHEQSRILTEIKLLKERVETAIAGSAAKADAIKELAEQEKLSREVMQKIHEKQNVNIATNAQTQPAGQVNDNKKKDEGFIKRMRKTKIFNRIPLFGIREDSEKLRQTETARKESTAWERQKEALDKKIEEANATLEEVKKMRESLTAASDSRRKKSALKQIEKLEIRTKEKLAKATDLKMKKQMEEVVKQAKEALGPSSIVDKFKSAASVAGSVVTYDYLSKGEHYLAKGMEKISSIVKPEIKADAENFKKLTNVMKWIATRPIWLTKTTASLAASPFRGAYSLGKKMDSGESKLAKWIGTFNAANKKSIFRSGGSSSGHGASHPAHGK